jgi:WD40 repeat protein
MEGAEAKLYLQLGHSLPVIAVAFSPDGRWALTGSGDKTARLWEVTTGKEIRRLEGHSAPVYSVAFSPDGRWALTGSGDTTARLWEVATGKEIRRLEGHSRAVESVAFSPDGRWALTGSDDKTARVWEVATGKEIRRLEGHSGFVESVAFSPDGRSALTGSDDKIARVWEVATGKELRRLEGHSGFVESVAFSPDGRWALTGGDDKTARLWEVVTGKEVRRLEGHSEVVRSVAFSPDGVWALTGSDDKTARLWEVATGKELRRLEGHSSAVHSVAFSPDGRWALTGSGELMGGQDSTARLWEVATGKEVRRLEGHSSAVWSLAFSPDGHWALTCSGDMSAPLWDLATGQEVRRLAVGPVAFSPDGRWALTGGGGKTARLWEVATGKEIRRLEGDSGPVYSVAFAPDGRWALTGSEDKTARQWEVATGKEVRRLVGHSGYVTSVAFSPDGRWALTGSGDKTARLWEVETGKEIRRLEGHSDVVSSVAFSPDGRWALTGSYDKTARLWEVATGQEIRRLVGHFNPVESVAFAPDGRWALTGSDDNTARVWEVATGKEIRRLEGHSGAVMSVAFSSDGRWALTGSYDGTSRLWDGASGRWLATLVSFREGGWAVVDPEGRYDASDPDNAPGLHFVAGDDVIELGQLEQRFYAPGLLGRIWRGEKLPEIAGSLKDIKLVPGVEVQPPAPGSVEATVRLTNRSGGIGKVIVKVNGRELPTATQGVTPDPNAKSAELKLNLEGATLSPTGKNVIEVFADNGDGVIRSRGAVAAWEREPPKQTPLPKLFAIVVGASSYDNPSLNLRYSAKDAVDFGHALELAGLGLFGKEHTNVTVLASGGAQEPTKENVRQAFDRVAKEAQGSDLLVVYLAGHGVAARNEQDQYYYLTKEARSTEIDRDPGLRAVTAISSAELKEWLSRTNMPLKQVVILDTCAAGAAFGDAVKLADRRDLLSTDQIRAIELLKDSTGSWILMGSAADAVSYEANRYAQGLLTYALLQGMQGAALEEDRVDVSKLFGFAQRQVEDLAKGIGGIQRPVMSAPKGQTFPIGLLTAEDRKQIHLATLKPQLLRARVQDDNDLDSLKLEPALRAELRAASLPVVRGNERQDPQIVYLDSVVDEVPDALIPQVRYTVEGDKVKVRLRLLQNGKPVAERNLELPKGETGELSRALLRSIVAESGRVK